MESPIILRDLDDKLLALDDDHVNKPLNDLRRQIALHYNVDPEDIRFSCGMDELSVNDLRSLKELNPTGTVNVLVKVAGGKVHGSLSRAGKVRGQTPKVDKMEKKKKLTGRARRRQQYIKRFKRATTTTGRGRRR
ncbi:hypothetical protein GJ496_011218 [Pomphorhynchus laevis]|nr:hypothetical protein GJ496_011218 [Pomphorhynchus laevis]